jgi:hypothetical protein
MAEQKKNTPTQKTFPLDIVGSSTYGRDPKVMASRTFNMITADGWLVDYAGYKKVLDIAPQGVGRGLFNSIRSNRLIIVISNKVYSVGVYSTSNGDNRSYTTKLVGTLNSYSGDVFIDENINNQIAICDKHEIYIYNYVDGSFTLATLPIGFIPGYVRYQDGYFIAPNLVSSQWALSAINNGLNWFWNAATGGAVLGALQTKADYVKAAFPMPGKGNLLLVMGNLVTELWTNVGGAVFPYQRSFSLNIDYGCINSATIAASDTIVAWLGANEKSGAVIMFTTGADIQQISSDGINYRFSKLKNPEKSVGFFMKLSGHLLYQLTFYDPKDNYTVVYDFTDQKFYDATDENMNYHIARKVAFFNNEYYFVSLNDGNLYQMSDNLFNFDYGYFTDGSPKVYEMPRVRVSSNMRTANQNRFSINNVTFTLEQGSDIQNDNNDPNYFPGIDMSMSKNGGISYGSYSCRKPIYKIGKRENRLNWWRLGVANDLVLQFRFFGKGAWRATNGEVNILQ